MQEVLTKLHINTITKRMPVIDWEIWGDNKQVSTF